MLKIRIFYFLSFTTVFFYAQQDKLSIDAERSFYSNWDTYFSYNLITAIDHSESLIYFASYNSIFSFNTISNQIEKFDTLNGLSGDEISALYHSEINNIIAIGYETGFIQIIDLNSDSIITVSYTHLTLPTIYSV